MHCTGIVVNCKNHLTSRQVQVKLSSFNIFFLLSNNKRSCFKIKRLSGTKKTVPFVLIFILGYNYEMI
jgi:hypothetical protein